MRARTVAAAAVALVLAAGCSSAAAPAPSEVSTAVGASASAGTSGSGVRVAGQVADGLNSPWGIVVLPGGDLLVASRNTGRVTRVAARDGAKTDLGVVPGVVAGGEGGLLGLALSPDYATDHQVYAYLTAADDNRIVRFGYDGQRPPGPQFGTPTTVLTGIPKGSNHDGGRIAFGPDGMLYAGTGESGRTELAQDPASLGGKILRMTPDGAPAPGNPFPGSVVYSLGHRNVQGLAWDGQGRLWASEFGQNTWDELNLITPGANYGWPVVEGQAHRAGYTDPLVQWHTDQASPSGIAYADGAIWMAALRGTRLWRIPVDGDHVSGAPEAFFTGTYGRLRTVVADGDGTLLVSTNNTDGRGQPRAGDDRILRVAIA
ncbi:PQQ-dependent sugar dehydrogenase [Kitasatospora sp. NBC_00374]|uniref:PQQ-dependent sugar dehydrogenase n=1 Tax=Kitasatospora sp. NBC_00374 TaxID=2975964 RepID=UPI0030DE5A49